MANHDPKKTNKRKQNFCLRSCLWSTLIKRRKPNTNTIDTIKRILNLEGKYSNKKRLNKRFKHLEQTKGVYNGPFYIQNAVEKIQPFIKLGTVKRSGRKIRVPYPITMDRSRKISINGLFNRIKKVNGKHKREILAQEIIEVQVLNGKSISYEAYKQLRINLQKNKKNIRYRW